MMRDLANVTYAGANHYLHYQQSATSLVDPEGDLVAHTPYCPESLLTCDIDFNAGTGLIANRYDPALYPD